MKFPLSINDLLSSNEIFQFHFFWRGPFSQWVKSNFVVDNHYSCCEQFMMFKKAELFNDSDIMQEILDSSNPKEIKALGRKVKNFDNKIWNEHKRDIVFQANFAKFSQNSELKEELLSTKGTILVEASPYDNIWGVGLDESDSRINNPNTWKGENLLGFALTEVREYLLEHKI